MDESTTATDNLGGTQDSGATETEQQTTATSSDNLETTSSTNNQDAGSSASNGNDAGDSASTPKFDEDLDDWATKTGRTAPTSDRERELYQEIRDGQREYSRAKAGEEAKTNLKDVNNAIKDVKPADDSQREDEDADPLEKRLNELEAKNYEERSLRQRSEFFTANQITKEQSDMMGEILKEKAEKGGKAAYDYWTNPENLDDWFQLAKARLIDIDTSTVAEEAARKERERIATESRASSTRRSATTTTTAEPKGYDRTGFFKSDD